MTPRSALSALLLAASFLAAEALAKDEAPRGRAALKTLEESLDGQAKRDYEAAVLLYKSGDFQRAALKFGSAFEASGDVRLLWNQAVSERALHHYARAIALVARYLARPSPLITPEAERKARAFVAAALPLTARFILETQQSGVEVWIDDQLVGETPLSPELRVDLGPHRLHFRKPNFVEQSTTVRVTSAADLRVKLSLSAVVKEGRLVVRAEKSDTILLDGRFAAVGRYDALVSSGPHRLRVTAQGARPFESRVVVEAERTRVVDVKLEPQSPRLPTWVWLAGGGLLAAGAGTASYFLLRSEPNRVPVVDSFTLPLR